jgi:dihydroorotate dehydrogenase (fumarate)
MDLTTLYMGLNLKNPVVVSPSPLCEDLNNIRQMEDNGAAAVVLHSLFEEQIDIEGENLNENLIKGTESFAEALSYFPDLKEYKLGPDEYLEHVCKSKKAVDIPVIGSLNGISTGGWIKYAKLIEDAGADGLELNIYFIPTDISVMAGQVESLYTNLVQDVTDSIKIPLAVKLSPYFSAIPNMIRRIDQSGASSLVLFNRFYQPDLDIEKHEVVPAIQLSTPVELCLRLRWIAILYDQIEADLAITGGVHSVEDVVKSIMVGAKVVMMTSALHMKGISYLSTILDGLSLWLEKHEYESIQQIQGIMSHQNVTEPAAFERANYIKVLGSF